MPEALAGPSDKLMTVRRLIAGLTQQEAAEVLGVTRRTADRYWAYARAWLLHAIEGRDGGD